MNLKYEQMSQRALVSKCYDLEEELQRTRGGLSDSMARNSDLRYKNTKLIRVQKKKKGVIDAKSKKIIAKSAWNSVLSNFIALGIAIPASLNDGSFTPYLLLSGVVSGILVPLQTYVSKRNEEI
jgi:hypothetical protein